MHNSFFPLFSPNRVYFEKKKSSSRKKYSIIDFCVLTPSYISNLHAHWIRLKREYIYSNSICAFISHCRCVLEKKTKRKININKSAHAIYYWNVRSELYCLRLSFLFFGIMHLFAHIACMRMVTLTIITCGWFDLCDVVHYKGNLWIRKRLVNNLQLHH